MKTRILLILIAFAGFSGLKAQTPTDVTQGDSISFVVTQSNSGLASTYTWTPDGSLSATVLNSSTNSVQIIFAGAALTTGNVSVYATSNATSCQGNTQTRSFRIVSQLAVSADFQTIAALCPAIGTGTGDLPSNTISFIDPTNGNAAVAVNGFKYQLVDQAGVASTSVAVTGLSGVTSYALDVATAFTNAEAGTHKIRITEITPAVGNVATFGSATYPSENFVVNEAPVITW